jgi:hypothetical protein
VQVREQRRRDVDVVLNQISFRYAELRPKKLVEVGEPNNAITDPYVERFFVLWEFDG